MPWEVFSSCVLAWWLVGYTLGGYVLRWEPLSMSEALMNSTCSLVLIALRQITRAIDLNSHQLQRRHGMTTPQALVLKEIIQHTGITAQEIGKQVHLSRATVTDILTRLETRGLISRLRSTQDRRKVHNTATAEGIVLLSGVSLLLQEHFVQKFNEMLPWEQTQFLAVFQRTADMMNAGQMDVAPILTNESISDSVSTKSKTADFV